MKRPFVWFAVGLITGILSAAYLNTVVFAAVIIIIAAVSVLLGTKNKVYEYFYVPVLCAAGFILCSHALNVYTYPGAVLDNKDVYVSGTVRSYYIKEDGNAAINLETNRIVFDDGVYNDKIKIFVTSENINVRAGDIIKVRGRLYGYDEPTNPYQTNYKMYMFSNGYGCNMWAESLENTGIDNDGLIYKIEKARENANDFFDSIMSEDAASVIKALTTGYKYDIDEDTRNNYKNLGISHLLAVSGIHVSVIAGAIFVLLTKILKIRRRAAMPIASVFLVLYLFFTGVSPSAMRAVMMTITFYVGYMISRNGDRLNITAFSAFIMLILSPMYLWNVSFQLSYAGITAVALTEDIIKDYKNIGNLSKALMFSLLVWIMTTPLTMYYFGGVSIIAPITNILFVPFLSFSTGLGILAALLSIFGEGIIVGKIAGRMIVIYNTFGDKIGTEGFYMDTMKPSLLAVIGIYAFILLVIYFRNSKRKLICTSAGFSAFCIVYAAVMAASPAKIVFFDAGQGDASAVYIPGKFMAVIDGGPDGGAESSVIPYIQSKSGKADILFISHTDTDHAEGALEIIERGLTKSVVLSDYADPGRAVEIIRTAEKMNIPVSFADAGDSFGNEICRIECLYPIDGWAESENETSLVLKFSVGETDVLFTGDISSDSETELLKSDIDCDIIKAAHHGSKNSSSEEFLRMTGAEFAVIEAEENNIYGFPHMDVIQRLDDLNIETYVTGRDGAVTFYLDESGKIEDIKTFKK